MFSQAKRSKEKAKWKIVEQNNLHSITRKKLFCSPLSALSKETIISDKVELD
jgi:hypothetical protein